MDIPNWVIILGTNVVLFFFGGHLFKWRGKILAFVRALDEFLDIITVFIDASADKKISNAELKKLIVEINEFRDALDKLRGIERVTPTIDT